MCEMMNAHRPARRRTDHRPSDYSVEAEARIEELMSELCDLLGIHRPDDLYGSVVIEARYQNGRPVGQVDVHVRYVMKRSGADRGSAKG